MTGSFLSLDAATTDAEAADGPSEPSRHPGDLSTWLHARVAWLEGRWATEIRRRAQGSAPQVEALVERFLRGIVQLLPHMLGPYREGVRAHFDRWCELYGSVAFRRGLAAGEVGEELHLLRELVIRELYRDPPAVEGQTIPLRDILRLNRAVDRAVTYATVGHTDALFFQFLDDGDDTVTADDEAFHDAVSEQVEDLAAEIRSVIGASRMRLMTEDSEH